MTDNNVLYLLQDECKLKFQPNNRPIAGQNKVQVKLLLSQVH